MSFGGCIKREDRQPAAAWCSIAGRTALVIIDWVDGLCQIGRGRCAQPLSPPAAREVYRLQSGRLRQGWDIILVARKRTAQAPWRELNDTFVRLCRNLDLWEDKL